MPKLQLAAKSAEVVFRVGFSPEPWHWTPWTFGPFTGRWDDPEAQYRVVYAAASPVACYLEVLARFREDPLVTAGMNEIEPDARDVDFPTIPAATVPVSWFGPRCLASAALDATMAEVQHVESVAFLHPRFVHLAYELGFADFDGAALRSSEPRLLTQSVSRFLYLQTDPLIDGVQFDSRHGNDLPLFAIFERSRDHGRSALVNPSTTVDIDPASQDFVAALELLGLHVES